MRYALCFWLHLRPRTTDQKDHVQGKIIVAVSNGRQKF